MTEHERGAELRGQLYEVAWRHAQRLLREAGRQVKPGDYPGNPNMSAQERRDAHLAMLRAYADLDREMLVEVAVAVTGTLAAGGNYGDIARAQKISRQAARQKWKRTTTRQRVTLTGGPHDGTTGEAYPDDDLRYIYRANDNRSEENSTIFAIYRKKYGAPDVYEFIGYQDAAGNLSKIPPRDDQRRFRKSPSQSADSQSDFLDPHVTHYLHKPRVYELAKELGVPIKNVLRDLAALNAPVTSAAASVKPSVAQAIRDLHWSRRDT